MRDKKNSQQFWSPGWQAMWGRSLSAKNSNASDAEQEEKHIVSAYAYDNDDVYIAMGRCLPKIDQAEALSR